MSTPERPWESPDEKRDAEKHSENQPSTAGIGCLLFGTIAFFALVAIFILAALLGL